MYLSGIFLLQITGMYSSGSCGHPGTNINHFIYSNQMEIKSTLLPRSRKGWKGEVHGEANQVYATVENSCHGQAGGTEEAGRAAWPQPGGKGSKSRSHTTAAAEGSTNAREKERAPRFPLFSASFNLPLQVSWHGALENTTFRGQPSPPEIRAKWLKGKEMDVNRKSRGNS